MIQFRESKAWNTLRQGTLWQDTGTYRAEAETIREDTLLLPLPVGLVIKSESVTAKADMVDVAMIDEAPLS